MSDTIPERVAVLEATFAQSSKTHADERDAIIARLDAMADRLAEIGKREQQAIGALWAARVGYAVLSTLAIVAMTIGLPKIGAWLISAGK